MDAGDHLELEGWFTDPFGRHEARWLSDGTPTKLVRDGDVESYDEPPEEDPIQDPVRIDAHIAPDGGADLIRAGDPGSGPVNMETLGAQMNEAALEGGAHPEIELQQPPPA